MGLSAVTTPACLARIGRHRKVRNRFGPESVYPIDLSFAELGRAFPVAAILYEVAKIGLTRLRERCGIEINPPCEGRAKCIDTSSVQAGENLRLDAGENQAAFGQAGKIEANCTSTQSLYKAVPTLLRGSAM